MRPRRSGDRGRQHRLAGAGRSDEQGPRVDVAPFEITPPVCGEILDKLAGEIAGGSVAVKVLDARQGIARRRRARCGRLLLVLVVRVVGEDGVQDRETLLGVPASRHRHVEADRPECGQPMVRRQTPEVLETDRGGERGTRRFRDLDDVVRNRFQ